MDNFKFKSRRDEVLDELDNALEVALEEIGLTAEGFAKKKCPVDTDRLRNSISHASTEDTAYVGTNVEYAVYVEMGTVNTKPQPYLRPAVTEHKDTYRAIVKRNLKGN